MHKGEINEGEINDKNIIEFYHYPIISILKDIASIYDHAKKYPEGREVLTRYTKIQYPEKVKDSQKIWEDAAKRAKWYLLIVTSEN
ncbi:MAG: hypothetical protein WBX01_14855 [Nitrososphaeraceae archaeon]